MLFGFALGSPGVLTFAANVIPDRLVAIQTAWEAGDHEKAKDIWLKYLPMFKIIHIEPVPNAVVYMLNRMGWNFGTQRIPVHEPSEEHKQKLDDVLRSLKTHRPVKRLTGPQRRFHVHCEWIAALSAILCDSARTGQSVGPSTRTCGAGDCQPTRRSLLRSAEGQSPIPGAIHSAE